MRFFDLSIFRRMLLARSETFLTTLDFIVWMMGLFHSKANIDPLKAEAKTGNSAQGINPKPNMNPVKTVNQNSTHPKPTNNSKPNTKPNPTANMFEPHKTQKMSTAGVTSTTKPKAQSVPPVPLTASVTASMPQYDTDDMMFHPSEQKNQSPTLETLMSEKHSMQQTIMEKAKASLQQSQNGIVSKYNSIFNNKKSDCKSQLEQLANTYAENVKSTQSYYEAEIQKLMQQKEAELKKTNSVYGELTNFQSESSGVSRHGAPQMARAKRITNTTNNTNQTRSKTTPQISSPVLVENGFGSQDPRIGSQDPRIGSQEFAQENEEVNFSMPSTMHENMQVSNPNPYESNNPYPTGSVELVSSGESVESNGLGSGSGLGLGFGFRGKTGVMNGEEQHGFEQSGFNEPGREQNQQNHATLDQTHDDPSVFVRDPIFESWCMKHLNLAPEFITSTNIRDLVGIAMERGVFPRDSDWVTMRPQFLHRFSDDLAPLKVRNFERTERNSHPTHPTQQPVTSILNVARPRDFMHDSQEINDLSRETKHQRPKQNRNKNESNRKPRSVRNDDTKEDTKDIYDDEDSNSEYGSASFSSSENQDKTSNVKNAGKTRHALPQTRSNRSARTLSTNHKTQKGSTYLLNPSTKTTTAKPDRSGKTVKPTKPKQQQQQQQSK